MPHGCHINTNSSSNPFISAGENKILPRKDLLNKGNLFIYQSVELYSKSANETLEKNVVFTKLSSCSSVRKIQKLDVQVEENTPSQFAIQVLPILIKKHVCPNFICKIHQSGTKKMLELHKASSSIRILQIHSFDREAFDTFKFQIDCKIENSSKVNIKFDGTLHVIDTDDNIPIQQSFLFNNRTYDVRLYHENIRKGTSFKFDEIFYDADIPDSNSYTLHFPDINYLSNGHVFGKFEFNCRNNHFGKNKLISCQKLHSNVTGSILYLKDQNIHFLKSFQHFKSTKVKAVILNENRTAIHNFSFHLLVEPPKIVPTTVERNNSYSFNITVNAPYLTRVGTLTHYKMLSLHRSFCPWFAVADNIVYLDIEGGLSRQGVQPGDSCKLELVENSSVTIHVLVNIIEPQPSCSSSQRTLACSEYSLVEECESGCGPATSVCKWMSENKELGQTYSTCTVDIGTCPDNKCDALEKLSPHICPQDCQDPEHFRGFNILINKKNNRPIARMSGVIVSCHGKCSAIIKSQAHSMKDEHHSNEDGSNEYPACGISCIITIIFLFGGSFSILIFFFIRMERKWKASSRTDFESLAIKDSIVDFELVKESDNNEIQDELYDKKWEFPRCNLVLEETIGEGEFGKVVSAKALNLNNKECTRVAVKMLKIFHTREQLYDLLSEYSILKEVDHPNVIKLLGACTKPDGPLLIIIEFAKFGSLRFHLRSQRKLYEEDIDNKQCITSKDVLGFSHQIAKGMDYLVGLKFVHRDLAARNVLLAEGYQCKISDFGLTRDIYTYEAYWKKSNGKIPVKWLSPESLFDNKYTSKSDVWSFGILMWELVTFGGCPYPGIPPERLLKLLKGGYRMEKPHACSQEIYEIMMDCWSLNPDARPTFKNLITRLEYLLQDAAKYLDITQSLVNNKTYLEPICSSSQTADDSDDKSNYEGSKDTSDGLLSKEIDLAFEDPDNGFSHSPPSIKYSQLIHKQSEENLASHLV